MTLVQVGLIASLLDRLGRALAKAKPQPRERRLRVVDAVAFGPGVRLAVVAFAGRELLVSVGKGGVALIAEDRA